MAIRLSGYGSSFATRERARELAETIIDSHDFALNLDGVLCSPSFLAELLVELTRVAPVSVFANDSMMALKVERLSRQLQVSDRVSVKGTLAELANASR